MWTIIGLATHRMLMIWLESEALAHDIVLQSAVRKENNSECKLIVLRRADAEEMRIGVVRMTAKKMYLSRLIHIGIGFRT